jgi:hypothetical protein
MLRADDGNVIRCGLAGLSAANRALADKEVDLRLQEAAGAELEDRELGQEPISQ